MYYVWIMQLGLAVQVKGGRPTGEWEDSASQPLPYERGDDVFDGVFL